MVPHPAGVPPLGHPGNGSGRQSLPDTGGFPGGCRLRRTVSPADTGQWQGGGVPARHVDP